MAKKFNCIKCGKCCEILPAFTLALKDFLNEDKSCKYYNKETKLCNIYDKRPDVCNIDKNYYLSGLNEKMSIEDYYKLNEYYCNLLNEKESELKNLLK